MSEGSLLHDSAGELRAPVRLVLFLLLAGCLILLAQVAVYPLVARSASLGAAQLGIVTAALTVAMLGAHSLAFRLGRWGSWADVGLGIGAAGPRTLILAAAAGALAIAVPALILVLPGWLSVEPGGAGSAASAAIQLALILLPAALWEELLARGYLFATLRDRWGAPIALVVTSVGFGLLHLGNPGANLQAVAQVTLAGFWLGGILLATGSLYAAWLAHAAWNWTMAALLHVPVSGLPFSTPSWRMVDSGPDWATGGAWGPEGGVPAVLGMAVSLVYLYSRRQRRMES